MKIQILPIDFKILNSIEQIGDYIFLNSILPAEFTLINSNIKSIDDYAFKDAVLPTNFAIPSTATIGTDAFKNVKLKPNNAWFDNDDNQIKIGDQIGAGYFVKLKTNEE